MAKIAAQAETSLAPFPPDRNISGPDESVAHAACRAAQEQRAHAIITFTQSGNTALLVSKHRPRVRIIAATPHERVGRKLSLFWGVTPVIVKTGRTTDDMIAAVEAAMLRRRFVKLGQLAVITAGVPIGVAGSTNLMKIHRVGEAKSLESV
jgi:pyruvate kinase